MKRFFALPFVLSIIIMLTSCTGNTPEVDGVSFSAAQAVQYLSANIQTDGKLQVQNEAYLRSLTGDVACKDAGAAAVGGTIPDMVAVFEAETPADSDRLYGELEKYVQDMASEYARYAPEQVSKINSAVLTQNGRRCVLCICGDNSGAKQVVNAMWSKDIAAMITASEATSAAPETTTEKTVTTTAAPVTTTKKAVATTAAPDTVPAISAVTDYEDLGNIFRAGNACYECFYYNREYASEYVKTVNSFVKKLPSTVKVYNMLIPLSSAITLPDNLYDTIKSGDQKAATANVQAALSKTVKPVDIYQTLRQHRDEYIYFRTDHHWTARGAYFAYTQLCRAKGIKATALSKYERVNYSGFLGSFYEDSGKSPKLKADTVTAYYPIHNDSIRLKYTDTSGESYIWPIIGDVSSYSANLKYSAFAAADNPYTVIKNLALSDGSVCVIIKESFGNALVPFLADIYQTIYEIDYRYYTGDVYNIINKNPDCDVLLANNLSMLQSRYLQGKLIALLT